MRRDGKRRTATRIVAVLGAALVLTGCAAHPTGAYSRMAHLDAGTMLASGELPPVVPGTDSDIVPTSYRLLAEHDGTEFWAGATRSDEVCFVAETGTDTQATCLDAEQFGRHGAIIRLDGSDTRAWLHTEYMTVTAAWTPLSANVALRD